MSKIVECVPNFSEGRRPEVVESIVNAMKGAASIELLDVQMNADHNRAVVSFIGEPAAVLEAAFQGCKKAAELIDLRTHKGEHPRIGATDVVPFVPISDVSMHECVELARKLGERIARELSIPVYLYEEAATSHERQNLASLREGEFEGLQTTIGADPKRKPDYGESRIHPSAGATAVGARFPLIAYNINLGTPDVSIAKKVAKAIRFKDGGYKYAKAMGFEIKTGEPAQTLGQVSINMTNYLGTPLFRVFETVRREAARYGVLIKNSEIVGMIPQKALVDTAVYYLQLDDFKEDQILEARLGAKESVFDFTMSVAAATPTPGGGSVAALSGAMGSALLSMVVDLTLKKSKDEELARLGLALKRQTIDFLNLVKEDARSFERVMTAYKLPKSTDAEKTQREQEIQEALKGAAEVPFRVMTRSAELLMHGRVVAERGAPSAISDVGVGAYALHTAFHGARLNVLVNLASIKDADFKHDYKSNLLTLENSFGKNYDEILNLVLTKLQ